MITTHQEYLTDDQGKRKAVVIPLDEWERIQEEMEELEDIRAYDEAKMEPSDPIPFQEAIAEIQKEKWIRNITFSLNELLKNNWRRYLKTTKAESLMRFNR